VLWPRRVSIGWRLQNWQRIVIPDMVELSPEFDSVRAIFDDPDIEREGGREFKSGAMTFKEYC
jgi:hypothetical protein